MEDTKVDKDIVEAVQHDMKEHPNKYIKNWNENNPEHAIPLKENQNEQQKKDESWKEAKWYKESQEISETAKKDTRQE